MSSIWLISYLALWLVVGFLLLAVVTLARQVGLLHRRLPPVGARLMNAGPEIGAPVPELTVVDLQGRSINLGGARARQTLALFVSPSCPACAGLMPALRSLWQSERRILDVFVISPIGDEEANRRFAERHRLGPIPVIVSPAAGQAYRVATLPYALLIDGRGFVQTKGLVNTREQLESLLHAADRGYPSVERLIEAEEDQARVEQAQGTGVTAV